MIGRDEGWLNDNRDEWVELFDPSQDLIDAIPQKLQACGVSEEDGSDS